METRPLRFCVNCKYHNERLLYSCRRDVGVTYNRSAIAGDSHPATPGGAIACIEREYEGSQYCGPSAKFYVEKSLTKRLIAWLKA